MVKTKVRKYVTQQGHFYFHEESNSWADNVFSPCTNAFSVGDVQSWYKTILWSNRYKKMQELAVLSVQNSPPTPFLWCWC